MAQFTTLETKDSGGAGLIREGESRALNGYFVA